MTQGILPFKYEEEPKASGMTSLGGLPIYLDLAAVMGIGASIDKHLQVKKRGWTDKQIVLSLMLLNLSGGDCVEDLSRLAADEGFSRLLCRIECQGMKRRDRRELDRCWRKRHKCAVVSPSAVFRYLSAFHDPEQEKERIKAKSFIPVANAALQGLKAVNGDMLAFIQSRHSEKVATLDMDATLVETSKRDAFHSYKGYKAYQPLNVWWAEQQVVSYTEFRDGNVPAGYEQLRVLQEALEALPAGVEKIRLRSDTAGYQHELMRWCEKGESKRFGRIEFAIGCDVTQEFKKAVRELEEQDWQPLYKTIEGQRIKTNQQWAEVCFIPTEIAHSKHAPSYRYLAIREVLGSMELPGLHLAESILPFPTLQIDTQRYKIFGLATNMDWEGGELIHWHRQRCGKSEEAHAVMKEDFAGGKLPSEDFGENAAWWWIMIMALNLNSVMKQLALESSWANKRMKAIRFSLINLPGRIIEHSRELIIRLGNNSFAALLIEIRRRIQALSMAPSG
jgi:hypothetical protein